MDVQKVKDQLREASIEEIQEVLGFFGIVSTPRENGDLYLMCLDDESPVLILRSLGGFTRPGLSLRIEGPCRTCGYKHTYAYVHHGQQVIVGHCPVCGGVQHVHKA